MKFLKKATVATAALSLVALGSIPTFATAVAADNLTFLQVLETVDNDALYESGENATADYIVSVRAVINDPALVGKKRIHEIVVKPSWKYGDADIVLSDINLHGQTANVYLAADKKSVRIDNLVDRQKVTFKIKRKPVFDSAQDKPEMLVNEVRASGEDANGNPVSAKTSQSETSCQPNKNHFGDTDACDTASIPVKVDPAEAVDAYIADPTQDNFNKASDAAANDTAQFDRLIAAATAFEKLDSYRANPDKAHYDSAIEAAQDFPTITESINDVRATNAVDAYIADPSQDNYNKASDATEGVDAQRERLTDAAIAYELLDSYRANPDKAHYDHAIEAAQDFPTITESINEVRKSEAAKAVDAYIADPSQENYNKASDATEGVDAQRERLTDAAIAYEKLNAYRARPNKARYEGAVEATKDFPSITEQLQAAKKNIEGATTELSKGINDLTDKPARAESFKEKLLRYRNDKNVQSATEDLKNFDKSEAAKAVDDYIKRPYKKDLYEKALKATENDPAQRARLEKASKNIKSATEDLKNFDKPVGVVPEEKQLDNIDMSSNSDTSNKDEAASENDKSTGAAADSQKSATENEPELARTGVTAVRALAGIAALLALCGVAALRTSRKA